MRNIKITVEQAREIQRADSDVKVAQEILRRVLAAVLAGHGIINADVLSMDTDSDPPTLVIAVRGANGPRPMPPVVAEPIEAEH